MERGLAETEAAKTAARARTKDCMLTIGLKDERLVLHNAQLLQAVGAIIYRWESKNTQIRVLHTSLPRSNPRQGSMIVRGV